MQNTRTSDKQAAPALFDEAFESVVGEQARAVAEAVRAHSIEVACLARELAPLVEASPGDAFAAGLLHDLGEVLLLAHDADGYLEIREPGIAHADLLRREQQWFGTDHALLAAEHLLDRRVADVVAAAVADHHDPLGTSDPVTIVVAAADELLDGDTDRRWAVRMLPPLDDPFGLVADS